MKIHYRRARKILRKLIGKNGVSVLEACRKKEVTDEEIMKETGLQLNTIRSLLNQLHYLGLIGYDREKDAKTNWYTYTWFAHEDKIDELIVERWEERLEELEEKLDEESNYVFFTCDDQCEKLPFELAAEYDFKCPECGKEMHHVDNKKVVESIIEEMKELQELMNKVEEK